MKKKVKNLIRKIKRNKVKIISITIAGMFLISAFATSFMMIQSYIEREAYLKQLAEQAQVESSVENEDTEAIADEDTVNEEKSTDTKDEETKDDKEESKEDAENNKEETKEEVKEEVKKDNKEETKKDDKKTTK